jgi:hypothetical protein
MPISKYYGGHGEKVMRETQAKYGDKKGKTVFYATANAQKKKEKKLYGQNE